MPSAHPGPRDLHPGHPHGCDARSEPQDPPECEAVTGAVPTPPGMLPPLEALTAA